MVQPTETATSEVEADASSEDSLDQPLIAEDQPKPFWEIEDQTEGEQQGAGQESEGDADTPAEGAAEAAEPETQPEAEAEEQPEEESGEAEEGEETEARTRSDEEFRKLQSTYDRRIADLESKVRQAEQQASTQGFQAQVTAYRDQIATRLAESMPEGDAKGVADYVAGIQQNAFQISERNKALESENAELRGQTENVARSTTARDLARKHGVPDSDLEYLLAISDAGQMERAARRFGQLHKTRQDAARKREAEVPDDGPEQQIDSGTGGTGPNDDQLRMNPNTPISVLMELERKAGRAVY